MAENISIPQQLPKEEKYKALLPQLKALLHGETDEVANLANTAAALWETFHFFWVGFYLIKNDELVLGPFQGPAACTRIAFGRGVCGAAWKERKTLIVPDVAQFPGHISCNSRSQSEIVVPLFKNGELHGVLDIDSDRPGAFDEIDARYLEKMAEFIII
ncbi:MAG: GAF domain-containing protein [Prevotellaceae bacterium]|jgi:GAF domain-containing protein|nr:GAF domain-containing protein [Prevotellaceae bacterium]